MHGRSWNRDIYCNAAALGITIAIYFGERAYRYRESKKVSQQELMVWDSKQVSQHHKYFILFKALKLDKLI